jgi:hypothetical protein
MKHGISLLPHCRPEHRSATDDYADVTDVLPQVA